MHSTTLHNAQQGYDTLAKLWAWAKPRLLQGQKLTLSVGEEKRTSEQNRLLWAMLGDVSRQVVWHGQRLAPEDWKHVFSASLKKQRVVPGLDGGFVVLGQSTSRMSKAEFSELVELIQAFGAQQGVEFSDAE
jgi:hypothetical protein